MVVRRVWVLRGPNIWASAPVFEVWVDLEDLKDTLSHELTCFNERLLSWLSVLDGPRPSPDGREEFGRRLRRGINLADVLTRLTLELQAVEGPALGPGSVNTTTEDGVYRVAIRYQEETFARACLDSALAICLAAVRDQPFDAAGEGSRLRALAEQLRPGLGVAAVLKAARARGIPAVMPQQALNENLVLLGQGTRQRRYLSAKTSLTGAVAEAISTDKELTKSLLRDAGIPVPEGRIVANAVEAWSAAVELGLPVVVKPRDADYGKGVALNLTTREQVAAAYDAALARSPNVLVERFARGDEYRVLVVGGRVLAAIRREPPQVVGDGQSTVARLVEQVNRDPRRGEEPGDPLSPIRLDATALTVLGEQGSGLDAVPPAGVRVLLRRNAHSWYGGTMSDVTDLVHPEVAARAVDVARIIGLDVAGLDLIASDIARPLEEQGGIFLEVNAEPMVSLHLRPSAGKVRPIGEAIVDMLFPPGETGRVPTVAVTGTNGKTTTTRLIAHLARASGRSVGMTCTDGIYINGRRIDTRDCSGPRSAQAVLLNPLVEVAVLETARGGILREGLGFDRCDVAVVTNIGEGDHLGLRGIETVEELAQVKRTLVKIVADDGFAILNADDPLVAAMAEDCPGKVIGFAIDGGHAVIARHRATGGRVVFVRDGSIVLAEGSQEEALLPLARAPMTHQGRAGFQVENALAAVAAAWALKIPRETIRAGLESFAGDVGQVPGRFNVLECRGATVIVDYAHNPSALAALVEAIDRFPNRRRSIVYSASNRRDQDVVRQGEILGAGFDRVVLARDMGNNDRTDGELNALLRQGLTAGTRVAETVEVQGELVAIETALRDLRSDDLVVIGTESIEESLAFVQRSLALLEKADAP